MALSGSGWLCRGAGAHGCHVQEVGGLGALRRAVRWPVPVLGSVGGQSRQWHEGLLCRPGEAEVMQGARRYPSKPR